MWWWGFPPFKIGLTGLSHRKLLRRSQGHTPSCSGFRSRAWIPAQRREGPLLRQRWLLPRSQSNPQRPIFPRCQFNPPRRFRLRCRPHAKIRFSPRCRLFLRLRLHPSRPARIPCCLGPRGGLPMGTKKVLRVPPPRDSRAPSPRPPAPPECSGDSKFSGDSAPPERSGDSNLSGNPGCSGDRLARGAQSSSARVSHSGAPS